MSNRSRIACILSLLLLSQTPVAAQADASWKIILNKKTVLKGGSSESSDTNVLFIKKEELSNNGVFRVEYDKKKEPGGWQRSIAIFDTLEAAVAQLDSTFQLQLYNKDLLKILWTRKKVYVYTWSSPMDKGMAAAIRIRRQKLCRIELID